MAVNCFSCVGAGWKGTRIVSQFAQEQCAKHVPASLPLTRRHNDGNGLRNEISWFGRQTPTSAFSYFLAYSPSFVLMAFFAALSVLSGLSCPNSTATNVPSLSRHDFTLVFYSGLPAHESLDLGIVFSRESTGLDLVPCEAWADQRGLNLSTIG